MSTTAPQALRRARLRFGGVLRSEWIKLRTLRSTVWAYLVTVVIGLGIALLLAVSLQQSVSPSGRGGPPRLPSDLQTHYGALAATSGVSFAQLAIAVLGVLVISGEYSTGMIRSSFAAVPRRLPVLWAKAIVFGVATFVVGLLIMFASYAIAGPVLSAEGISTSLADDGLVRALFGGAGYLALVGLMSLGIGTILRSAAGGIAVSISILLVLPIIGQLIPADWAHDAARYLPSNAGQGLYSIAIQGDDVLEPWQALLVLAAWAAVALAAGAVLITRRDA